MNLSTASRTFQLLSRIFDVRTATEPFLPPAGEKLPLPLRAAQQPFPRETPESQGVSSRHLQRFLEELAGDRSLYAQDVMVLRNGRVLCEAAFGDGQELLILVTELTISHICARFIGRYGCKEYFQRNRDLLFYERQQELITTLAHEGYPGHLYQNSFENTEDYTPVRNLFYIGGYTEGWGLYSELYAYDFLDCSENESDFLRAMAAYQGRSRRYGGV